MPQSTNSQPACVVHAANNNETGSTGSSVILNDGRVTPMYHNETSGNASDSLPRISGVYMVRDQQCVDAVNNNVKTETLQMECDNIVTEASQSGEEQCERLIEIGLPQVKAESVVVKTGAMQIVTGLSKVEVSGAQSDNVLHIQPDMPQIFMTQGASTLPQIYIPPISSDLLQMYMSRIVSDMPPAYMPRPGSVVPCNDTVWPQSGLPPYGPATPQTHYLPQISSGNFVPQVASNAHQFGSVVTQVRTVLPQVGTVVPQIGNLMPQVGTAMIQSGSVAPLIGPDLVQMASELAQINTVMPQTCTPPADLSPPSPGISQMGVAELEKKAQELKMRADYLQKRAEKLRLNVEPANSCIATEVISGGSLNEYHLPQRDPKSTLCEVGDNMMPFGDAVREGSVVEVGVFPDRGPAAMEPSATTVPYANNNVGVVPAAGTVGSAIPAAVNQSMASSGDLSTSVVTGNMLAIAALNRNALAAGTSTASILDRTGTDVQNQAQVYANVCGTTDTRGNHHWIPEKLASAHQFSNNQDVIPEVDSQFSSNFTKSVNVTPSSYPDGQLPKTSSSGLCNPFTMFTMKSSLLVHCSMNNFIN